MTDRELMQMALDALDSDNPHIQVGAAISLRYRLAQPESLDLIKQQRKDIEELTYACQLLMRTNKELLDELQRSNQPRPAMDQGS